ncbi:hypothetical protein PHYPO_G00193040 [Pangasianodon hypophthalmus]|uniref:Uncharacterized protein n=1 Tax=Pangasianodon hypophthalmus TaxID=310915 RepID=A0A5N5PHT5_PANHP|nr:uncharacterized protein zgc:194930 [Pangasianodon hypophthalmus]XP_053089631.1 uncharacterized protein zgc:194930 [Pangasianodon hypophthalmus]KAB5579260.1 hypothetical protein PHYPO_G00193040 [Pangasianodon hypophthalmus]
MGCRCCSMIKSYIYEPTDPVEVNGLKQDPSTNSLVSSYQCHSQSDVGKKQGFHNLGYTSNSNLSKSDIENNHINQARSNQPQTAGGNSSLYILHPDGRVPPILPSAPPICPVSPLGTEPGKQTERFRDSGLGNGSDGYLCRTDQEEEGRQGAGDTADEESVISVDIHTSSTSLSSADTKLVIDEDSSFSRKAGSKEKDTEDTVSVTDSMVAEALAALEAATAGEEYE